MLPLVHFATGLTLPLASLHAFVSRWPPRPRPLRRVPAAVAALHGVSRIRRLAMLGSTGDEEEEGAPGDVVEGGGEGGDVDGGASGGEGGGEGGGKGGGGEGGGQGGGGEGGGGEGERIVRAKSPVVRSSCQLPALGSMRESTRNSPSTSRPGVEMSHVDELYCTAASVHGTRCDHACVAVHCTRELSAGEWLGHAISPVGGSSWY